MGKDSLREENAMYEIRVYYQFANMDPNYYRGSKGIWRRWKARTPAELIRKWNLHLGKFEGETYSVWDNGEPILGGAYDPDDDLILLEYFGFDENDRDKYM